MEVGSSSGFLAAVLFLVPALGEEIVGIWGNLNGHSKAFRAAPVGTGEGEEEEEMMMEVKLPGLLRLDLGLRHRRI